jgi:hypothetical protein
MGENIIEAERVEFIYDLGMKEYGLCGDIMGETSDYFIPGFSYTAKTRWTKHKDTGEPLMIVEMFGAFLMRDGDVLDLNEGSFDNGWAISGKNWNIIRTLDPKWMRIR